VIPDAIDQLVARYTPAVVCDVLASVLTPERIARIDAVLDMRLASLITVCEDTYDPHNAAAAIRTSEALGLQEMRVIEPAERFSATRGITRGAHKWIDLVRDDDAVSAIAALRARGFRTLATLPDAPHDVEDAAVDAPVAVLFGNEHAGLSPAAVAACDGAISVRMFGMTESFNLSVTVGLAMSRLAVRRRAHLGAPGDLDPERRARLRARWFALRVRAVEGVLERLVTAHPVHGK
jgi:tRNA (guanosine-2'-O-)-methyltransferase